jgi:hypothetical protein
LPTTPPGGQIVKLRKCTTVTFIRKFSRECLTKICPRNARSPFSVRKDMQANMYSYVISIVQYAGKNGKLGSFEANCGILKQTLGHVFYATSRINCFV